MIDWSRVAKPQPKIYDVGVLWVLQPDWSPLLDKSPVRLGDAVNVHLTRIDSRWAGFEQTPDITSTQLDAELLPWVTQWSDGWQSFTTFVDEIWAFRKTGLIGAGCTSGHHEFSDDLPMHAVYASFNDWPGCAQGLYHEFAHVRLESMGIGIDHHNGLLLLNPSTELYDSSVRYDAKRPMSAVLHGFYAWLMYMENDWHNYNAGLWNRAQLEMYSYRNIRKLVNGWTEVQRYARWTPEGQIFWKSCTTWTDDLVSRMRIVFDEPQVPVSDWTYLEQ